MKFYTFDELGYLSEMACENLKKNFDGKTYMNFKIQWSNVGGNCTLIVGTDCDESEEEIKGFFHWYVIEYFARKAA